jgi:hypothetical protein
VFTHPASGPPQPTSVARIALPDGPESLVVDATRRRAYTHEWGGRTHAIDLGTRKPVAAWDNGCKGSRGIALDEARGFLFVGCEEGKAVVLDAGHDGRVLGSLSPGVDGVDIIAYNGKLAHLYLPGASSATMAILAVAPDGTLRALATVKTVDDAHCVSEDDRGGVWVCDPRHGRLMHVSDH